MLPWRCLVLDVRDALAFVKSNAGEALMFALVSTSSEGPAKLQTLKRCDLERVLNALEELPERKYERESCERTFSELANALEANMRRKIQEKIQEKVVRGPSVRMQRQKRPKKGGKGMESGLKMEMLRFFSNL